MAVDDIYSSIEVYLDKSPYAFFGHSMGCWLAYELTYKIKEQNHKGPLHIFIAAKEAPHLLKEDHLNFHNLPIDVFKKEIIKLGGTPKEIFEN